MVVGLLVGIVLEQVLSEHSPGRLGPPSQENVSRGGWATSASRRRRTAKDRRRRNEGQQYHDRQAGLPHFDQQVPHHSDTENRGFRITPIL